MKASINLSLAALLLISTSIACQAQQAPPAQQQNRPPVVRALTPEQQASLDKQDQDIGQAAMEIIKLIDQDKAGVVWDQGSPLAKQIVSRDDFMKKVAQDRSPLGQPGLRMPMGVRHYRYDGSGNIPAGAYINVRFDTQFSRSNRTRSETVSFILDSDRVWRFVGYSVS
ncbi:membrane protein [Caballeronia glebae]|uniref:Membrane protein n=1 Tax=Caballeronia glebae TaxID=1777143 RepID=A0A158AYR5_9BURK|nr:DUF4019 domain-containing protein [Caballeronia glebae]SAK62147.1 membrane protein [Caballeronia glebae]